MNRSKVGEIVHSSFTIPHNQRLVYRVSGSFMYNETLKQKFRQLSKEEDEDTCRFLDSCYTDANGYTGRGEMFVFSWKQLKRLIPFLAEENNGNLLDIGAGDGGITARIASHFNRIVTTESSTVMQKKLRTRGWECYEPESFPWDDNKHNFDLVMCLNVLDRADKPLTLLRDLHGMVKPGTGRLVLAVVLPWCPFVESGNKQMQPSEILDMGNATCKGRATFEASFERIVEKSIIPVGYEVEAWTRLPYISKGDVNSPYYTLSDAVLILKPVES